MVRTKDRFWVHAEELSGKFKCKYCCRVYSGGVSRLKSHLSQISGRGVEICDKVSPDVQIEAFTSIGGDSNKRAKSIESTNVEESGESFGVFGSRSFGRTNQMTMQKVYKKKNKDEVDQSLAKFFILNNISLNVVQSESFIDLMRDVANYGPGYIIPSYSTLRTKLILNEKKEAEIYVEKVKSSWHLSGCTIMSDGWTDLKGRAFTNVIAYSPGGAIFVNSFESSRERKTAMYLKDILSSVIEDIGPDNVVQLITDNGSNFLAAGDMLVEKYPRMYKTRCAAHGLQLLLKDIYKDVEWVRIVIDEARLIENYMYKHTVLLALMREATQKELKHPCVRRFASNIFVLQSLVDVEDELKFFVASAEWRESNLNKSRQAKKVAELVQNNDFWNRAKEVVQALEPIIQVLRLVDSEGSTSGYLYDAMEKAREVIKCRLGVWWDYCGDLLPVLRKYAVRILSQPCSSSSCERNWSAYEAAQTKKTNRLSPEMLEKFVYTRMNALAMKKWSTLESQDLEPINLEKLHELPEYMDHEKDGDRDDNEEIKENPLTNLDLLWLN